VAVQLLLDFAEKECNTRPLPQDLFDDVQINRLQSLHDLLLKPPKNQVLE